MRIVIVGEMNPHGSDPAFALYHLPRHASGNRLREIMGLSDALYHALDKVNLCTGCWDLSAAQERVWDLLVEYDACVLLGSKVRRAFRGPPPFEATREGGCLLVALPHPSGLCRAWNDPTAVRRARDLLRHYLPDVPWGGLVAAGG